MSPNRRSAIASLLALVVFLALTGLDVEPTLVPIVALVFASAALGDMREDGTLVYLKGAASRQRQLTVFERTGELLMTVGEPLDVLGAGGATAEEPVRSKGPEVSGPGHGNLRRLGHAVLVGRA